MKSSGKVVYVTATLPYVCLGIFLAARQNMGTEGREYDYVSCISTCISWHVLIVLYFLGCCAYT